MWQDNEIDALSIGLELDFYWGEKMTPIVFKKYCDAYSAKMKREMTAVDVTNHLLGLYIKRAVGDVLAGKNRYPDKPFLSKVNETPRLKRVFTEAETEAYLAKIRKEGSDDPASKDNN